MAHHSKLSISENTVRLPYINSRWPGGKQWQLADRFMTCQLLRDRDQLRP